MPVIHDALREELERLLEKEQAYKKQLSLLPKGRIHDKLIGNVKNGLKKYVRVVGYRKNLIEIILNIRKFNSLF